MRVPRRLLAVLLSSLVLFGAGARADDAPAAKTSENDPRLARLLKRFPRADADRDGVLTQKEADAFRASRRQRTKPTYADVSYGPHERNVLDFWQAPSKTPAPVVVYIHGGGFVGGSKNGVGNVDSYLRDGISFAAIHYRFVTTHIFPAPFHDGARAIQFIRSKAKAWNVDRAHIAAYGGSAGAGISLWLGFHDDLADPESKDPVERESSRVQVVGSLGGQSSYDPHVISKWVGGRAHEHPSIFKAFGVRTLADFDDPKLKPLLDECSPITHLSKGDAPVFMWYSEPDAPLPEGARPGQGIHHPAFGHQLKKAMDVLGIEAVYRHRDAAKQHPSQEMHAFFKKHLGVR
jgi:acetyl esterase